jgi:MFS family permease
MGHLGDRYGARELLIALMVLAAPVAASVALVQNVWQFVLVASALAVLERGSAAVRAGLIASMTSGAGRIRIRAYLRSAHQHRDGRRCRIGAVALVFDTRPRTSRCCCSTAPAT